ncbi:non-specific lipid transfer protein GPI-anchored 5-like [Diospyros lotus]|uniref:non-specific lipid transfer protein GPI-anchored 5-like n=1 Tax=Diospyros lotus TaxID=55363 RepID=UPI0022534A07|nr:non-specific lipid transfer protein GPI-anchored 5-like [Diospyros lotus]
MAHQGVAGVVAMVVVIWAGAVSAQSSSSCSNALISLSPCLNYITGNTSTPSSGCCSQLANVVRSQPQCLCEAINGGGGSSLGINVNQTQALALPSACNVQTPPISRCKAASPPSSPAGTPEYESQAPLQEEQGLKLCHQLTAAFRQ